MQNIIYDILRTQLQFGVYRYMDSLPTIEEASVQFSVSVDTVRLAYLKLKKDGYISLTKNIGAKALIQYGEEEIAQHIQGFFAPRKDALIDLGKSMRPLFGNIQWIGLKHASLESHHSMEQYLYTGGRKRSSFAIWQHLEQRYGSLGNRMLMQLARQVYLFLHMPFFSLEENIKYVGNGKKYVRDTIALCRQKEWGKLRSITGAFQETLADSLCRFYQEKISIDPQAEKIDFSWSSYEKPSQRCYTLAMELLISISRGIYPAESYLPSADRLAIEKDVSVSTVRRALTLLNSIGAVKSSRPLGARVIPFMQSKENCDFTQPAIRGRLLALAESSQIFALSCKEVSHLTLESLDASSMDQWKRKLYWVKEWQHYDMLNYAVLDLITQSAPYRAIQTIYSQLLLQFMWGNALRGGLGNQETTNAVFEPYLTDLIKYLEEFDIPRFSAKIEESVLLQSRIVIDQLTRLGIQEAKAILIPDEPECD